MLWVYEQSSRCCRLLAGISSDKTGRGLCWSLLIVQEQASKSCWLRPSSDRYRARQASSLRQQAVQERMQAVGIQQLRRTGSRSFWPLLYVQRHATVPASSRHQAAAVQSQAGVPTSPLWVSRKSNSLPVPHPRSASSVRPCSASRSATRVWRCTARGAANRGSLVDTGAGYLQTDSDGDSHQGSHAHRASL